MNQAHEINATQLTQIVGGDGDDDGAGFAPLTMPDGWDAGIEYLQMQLEILWAAIQAQNVL